MGISLVPSTPHEGLTLLSTTTLSGASVTLSSIPQNYRNLQLVIRDLLPATDGTSMSMRLNGDSNANRYSNNGWNASQGAAVGFGSDAFTSLATSLDNQVTENFCVINLYDYTNTVTWKYGTSQGVNCDSTSPDQLVRNNYHLWYNQTAAISSITILLASGNITSGTALLYGVN